MQRRTSMIDAGPALVVLGATLGILASGGFGTPDPQARSLDGLAVVLATVSSIPLIYRRPAPMVVYAITGSGSLALLGLRYTLDVPLGAAIAAYTLAAASSGDDHAMRRRAAMLGVGAFVPAFAVVYESIGADAWLIAPELLGWAAVFAGLWIAADRARLRGELIADLEERAQRSEREAGQERRLAVAEERNRIARELHDSAGHAVNVILVQAGAARLLHERNPDRSREAVAAIEDVARSTMLEIDRIVRVLREDDEPEPRAPMGTAAIYELFAHHRVSGLDVTTDIRGEPCAVPYSVAWATYRILQESLTNAARHGCGRADVIVSSGSDAVEVTVINPIGLRSGPCGATGLGVCASAQRYWAAHSKHGRTLACLQLHALLPLSKAAR